jgi:hypothetical protein
MTHDNNAAPELLPVPDELCGKNNESTNSPCSEPAWYRCHKCSQLYCLDHASEVDPKHFCLDCLHVSDTTVESVPLVDAEGVRQQGRLLHPVGNAFTEENKLIAEMDEEELKTFIKMYVVLVREAEQLKTFREITLAHAKHEAFGREIAKIEKLTGEIYFPERKPKLVKTPKAKASVEESLAEKLKKAGVTPEMLQALIDAKRAKW